MRGHPVISEGRGYRYLVDSERPPNYIFYLLKEWFGMLSDHQDTDSFSYNRTWDDFQDMLEKAERQQNMHFTKMHQKQSREDRI